MAIEVVSSPGLCCFDCASLLRRFRLALVCFAVCAPPVAAFDFAYWHSLVAVDGWVAPAVGGEDVAAEASHEFDVEASTHRPARAPRLIARRCRAAGRMRG